ncbi:MAG: hypothetical protein LZF60_80078 [Nitrospira sp.]|nr:MAG: hypothetical protein LZF60_80078 [Nitrospira sp.]
MSIRIDDRQTTSSRQHVHAASSFKKPHRGVWGWVATVCAAVIILGGIALWFIDEPLRAYAERQLNSHIAGYTFRIGALDFHPIGLSLDLENVTVLQDAHPEPPLAHLAEWHASIHWEALLSGRLVSDHIIDRPVIHFTRPQAAREARDAPAQTKSWQEALFAIYPLQINELSIKDGDVTYLENAASNPIRLTNIHVLAENIRNVRSKPLQYPSRVQVEAVVFGGGRIKIDGHADFLAEPSMGVDADISLQDINLADLLPLTAQRQIHLTQGSLTTTGHVEFAPAAQEVRLASLNLHDVKADFVHAARTTQKEQATAQQVSRAATKAANHPALLLRIDQGKVERSEFGFVNQATNPAYRLFISGMELELENWSNQLSEGTARVRLDGMLMGTGATKITGAFRPEVESPDFDFSVRIVKTQVTSLNQLLRAYRGIDAAGGFFSLFSEVSVKNGTVKGYLKPLFKDVTAYDPQQDQGKGILNQIYEKTINALADILKNTPREEVATKSDLSGTVENPQASTWELVLTLFQNAFFDAVLPGLEGKVRHER